MWTVFRLILQETFGKKYQQKWKRICENWNRKSNKNKTFLLKHSCCCCYSILEDCQIKTVYIKMCVWNLFPKIMNPYEIHIRKGVGRALVSNRDLAPQELILSEMPVIVAPVLPLFKEIHSEKASNCCVHCLRYLSTLQCVYMT